MVVKSYKETRLILEDIRKLRKKKDKISEELHTITDFIKVLETEYPKLYEQTTKERKQ
jgi:hypothetical protein